MNFRIAEQPYEANEVSLEQDGNEVVLTVNGHRVVKLAEDGRLMQFRDISHKSGLRLGGLGSVITYLEERHSG